MHDHHLGGHKKKATTKRDDDDETNAILEHQKCNNGIRCRVIKVLLLCVVLSRREGGRRVRTRQRTNRGGVDRVRDVCTGQNGEGSSGGGSGVERFVRGFRDDVHGR